MKHIYYKDAKGKKVRIEVTDEVAAAYRESLREEWLGDAKEKYHTLSLDKFAEEGYEIMAAGENAESRMLIREDEEEKAFLFKRITKARSTEASCTTAFWRMTRATTQARCR